MLSRKLEKEFETVSYRRDGPSITEQLQSDPKTKEAEQKCSNTIDEIQQKEPPTVGPQSSIDFTVTLGSDQSRSAVHDGDTEHFTDVGNTHAEYDLSDRETRTDILITPYVPYDLGSYAEISSVFKVYGSGSETASIMTTTHHQGALMACAGASSEIGIKFTIENLSGVGAYSSPILDDRTSNIFIKKPRSY